MKITPGPLPGILLLTPTVLTDERGFFYEGFIANLFKEHGMPDFIQENYSLSKKNVLRGLHYQQPEAQGKLVTVFRGSIWDVCVDIRLSSETFGQWFGIYLNDQNHTQMYIPPGFAHGFCVLSDEALFHYKCSAYYHRAFEKGIAWHDATLNINWPVENPIIAEKDRALPLIADIPHADLFP